eukprot:Skav208362  [mRNA]  locus=scaffold1964:400892:403364:+ [translate_table: standard]
MGQLRVDVVVVAPLVERLRITGDLFIDGVSRSSWALGDSAVLGLESVDQLLLPAALSSLELPKIYTARVVVAQVHPDVPSLLG